MTPLLGNPKTHWLGSRPPEEYPPALIKSGVATPKESMRAVQTGGRDPMIQETHSLGSSPPESPHGC